MTVPGSEPAGTLDRLPPPEPVLDPRTVVVVGPGARGKAGPVGKLHATLPSGLELLHYLALQKTADGPAQVGAVRIPEPPAQLAERRLAAVGGVEGLADAALQVPEAPAYPQSFPDRSPSRLPFCADAVILHRPAAVLLSAPRSGHEGRRRGSIR